MTLIQHIIDIMFMLTGAILIFKSGDYHKEWKTIVFMGLGIFLIRVGLLIF